MNKYKVLNTIVDDVKREWDHMNILILIQGISGSGKSTFAKDLEMALSDAADDAYMQKTNYTDNGDPIKEYTIAVPCEADNFWLGARWQLRNTYEFKPQFLDYAHMQCLGEAAYNLNHFGLSIVSNTFTSEKALKPYYTLAERMNAKVILVKMDTRYNDIHMVPEQAKKRMERQLEGIKDLYKPTYIIDSDEQI